MNIQSNAMAQSMAKVCAIAALTDHAARRFVHCRCADTVSHGCYGGIPCLTDQLVDPPHILPSTADSKGSGDIRIPALINSAEVDQQEIAPPQLTAGRCGMGQRSVRPRGRNDTKGAVF